MQSTASRLVIWGALGLCGFIAVAITYRLTAINEATRNTTEFCQTVKVGDKIAGVLKKARDGANGVSFQTIFEQREGQPTWPRHLIWMGPHYKRVYCGLEPGPQDEVLATHIGPIDEATPGFFEDWINN